MSNACKNCGISTKYKYCKFCAEWLARIDDHKLKLRKVRKRPAGANKNQQLRWHRRAIEDYNYMLTIRKNPKKGLTAKEYRMAEANK